MKHEFTDTQLRQTVGDFLEGEAIDLGTSALGEFFWTQQVKALRKMLNALPEPTTDEWEQCRFEDIQKGDRVKVVDTHEAGDQTVYEGDVVQVSKGLVMTAHHQLHSVYNSKWYRIPAPVVHPDPAEHPVIANVAVAKPGTDVTHRYDYATWDAEFHYECWNHDGSYYGSWEPNTITEWEPAKVVPKEVKDND